ncbi:hypothetical protein ACQPW1_14590 [Nocardia sp. CA-128927]|uniref:hypothetical protein n=1 Tax=Nocardia sp. CA-128927 TaxID=3239975 RepID=UPI003D97139F
MKASKIVSGVAVCMAAASMTGLSATADAKVEPSIAIDSVAAGASDDGEAAGSVDVTVTYSCAKGEATTVNVLVRQREPKASETQPVGEFFTDATCDGTKQENKKLNVTSITADEFAAEGTGLVVATLLKSVDEKPEMVVVDASDLSWK